MLALTFSTGIIDAVGYLGLDRVFTGNMTGNVVILGMALSGTTDLPVVGPAIALVLYFLGAVVGGRLLRGHREGWTSATTIIFGLVSAMLLACAIFTMVVPWEQSRIRPLPWQPFWGSSWAPKPLPPGRSKSPMSQR